MDRCKEALTAARQFIQEAAECPEYGWFPGGDADPRRFTPDSENTQDKLDAHRLACEAWERGERPTVAWYCPSFGGGVYVYVDEDAKAVLVQIDAALDLLGVERDGVEWRSVKGSETAGDDVR
jgi:hypothetical protein